MGGVGPYAEAEFPLNPPHAKWLVGGWREEAYKQYLLLYRLFVFSRFFDRFSVLPRFDTPKTEVR